MIGDHVYKGWNVRLLMGDNSLQWAAHRDGFKVVYGVHLETVHNKVDKVNGKMQTGRRKRCPLW